MSGGQPAQRGRGADRAASRQRAPGESRNGEFSAAARYRTGCTFPTGDQRDDRPGVRQAVRPGLDGWVDDVTALFGTEWGFDPADITVPTRILHGGLDTLVPPAHGEWLAARVRHDADQAGRCRARRPLRRHPRDARMADQQYRRRGGQTRELTCGCPD